MPKKTRREKILAEARRIIQQSSQTPASHPVTLPDTKESDRPARDSNFQYQSVDKTAASRVSEYDSQFPAIRKDLVKTVILAVGAIGIELILYFRLGGKLFQ